MKNQLILVVILSACAIVGWEIFQHIFIKSEDIVVCEGDINFYTDNRPDPYTIGERICHFNTVDGKAIKVVEID